MASADDLENRPRSSCHGPQMPQLRRPGGSPKGGPLYLELTTKLGSHVRLSSGELGYPL